MTRLPASAHTARPWRIHELTRDFRVEDVWALPTPGGPDDFPALVDSFATSDPERGSHGLVAALWTIRRTVGRFLGWDNPATGVDARVGSLRERLPPDLQAAPRGPNLATASFRPLYLLGDEWAAEIANRTMHGVLHLGWVDDGKGGYRGQMAILVKPNGILGELYMAAIRPARHLVVYPAMLREIGRRWRSRSRPR